MHDLKCFWILISENKNGIISQIETLYKNRIFFNQMFLKTDNATSENRKMLNAFCDEHYSTILFLIIIRHALNLISEYNDTIVYIDLILNFNFLKRQYCSVLFFN